MDIIESNLFKLFPELIFGFSTKNGLNRTAPFYYNMSLSVGDIATNVHENRMDFFNKLNIKKVVFQKQIHSDIINIVKYNTPLNEGDGMITNETNVGLAISAADCVPIFIYDKEKKIIAGVHSGWRGTQKQILKKTIEKLKLVYDSKPENIFVYIGPCISVGNYQVSDDFINYFEKEYLEIINGKIHLDLRKANFNMLIEENIPKENIEISDICSFEDVNLHSYRREGSLSGRALGVISIKGKI